MGLNSLKDVLQEQLKDLYSAETQLVTALPKMQNAATHDELKTAFREHLEETKGHVARCEEALAEFGFSPTGGTTPTTPTGGTTPTKPTGGSFPTQECKGMKGLIQEGDEVMKMTGDPMAKDAAIIAAAQRVEHYEIAAWGTVRQLAKECGYDGIEDMAGQTLDEEHQADKLLTKIATGGVFSTGVNQRATT